MPLISQLIMQICLNSTSPTCVESLHKCVEHNFSVTWYTDLSWQQELVLPTQINWCVENGTK